MVRCRCYIVMILVFWAGGALAAEPLVMSLANVQRAIDGNDHVLLEKYVDLRGIITRGVDRFVADYAANPPGGEGDPLMEMLSGGLSRESGSAAAGPMKMMLVEETRKFVIRGVASGDFSGRPSKAAVLPDGGLLAVLFADASTARKELRGVRVNPAKGDTATAQATVYDHGSERSYPVQLDLRLQPEGYWKVTDVKNMADLIRRVRKEAEER
ncbi:hypothetical protein SAMN04488082_1157 [Desulfomicrobium apsheronum]|uniref:DUF2939 domain-containing protein n=1 Tax=Desulfomicrobium apsheronum TaxID=52560 RepID=A0A1I3X3W2_9BACT|nr:hypothetical protein [Desulfomicrobium apsheronum]SFK13511.1 hypothetical protein SAMN04488082_1157 [Desulfomicrobium apsheronum]